MKRDSRRTLLILSFTLLVVTLGYGIAMPMMPFYIERFGVSGTQYGWMMSTYSLMQLICAPLWGMLSDRWGRKPILSLGVLGYALAFFLFGLADSFAMLFTARALSGVLSSATTPTALATIGDNTEDEEKSQAMGQLGAMVGAGAILGPVAGGLLSGFSIQVPFFVGSGLALLAFLLVLVLLPGDGRKRKAVESDGEEVQSKSGWRELLRTYLGALRSPAGMLLVLIFIMSFGLTNFQNMIGLYAVDKLAFDTRQVSSIWMVMGAVLVVVQGGLAGPLAKRVKPLRLIRLGLLGGALGYVLVVRAGDYLSSLAALGFFILSLALISPALNASISRYAGEHQGALMGLSSAMTSLGRVLGPLWGGYIYDINIDYPFYSGALTLLVGIGVSFIGRLKNNANNNLT